MSHGESSYGLWGLVFLNSSVFIIFAFSFFKPATARDWRTFGAFAAFISAFVVVRWLIRYVSTHDFSIFAWYRIAFGLVVLATAWSGIVAWSPN